MQKISESPESQNGPEIFFRPCLCADQMQFSIPGNKKIGNWFLDWLSWLFDWAVVVYWANWAADCSFNWAADSLLVWYSQQMIEPFFHWSPDRNSILGLPHRSIAHARHWLMRSFIDWLIDYLLGDWLTERLVRCTYMNAETDYINSIFKWYHQHIYMVPPPYLNGATTIFKWYHHTYMVPPLYINCTNTFTGCHTSTTTITNLPLHLLHPLNQHHCQQYDLLPHLARGSVRYGAGLTRYHWEKEPFKQ